MQQEAEEEDATAATGGEAAAERVQCTPSPTRLRLQYL